MDRSAWAISLVAAVVSWYLPGPCAAQSPPKSMPQSPPQFLPPLEPPMDTPATPRREPAAPALTASELLPALKPLTDPLADPSRESSVSPGKHAGVQSPLMTDTASAVPGQRLPILTANTPEPPVQGWPLLTGMLSPSQARPVVSLYSEQPTTRPSPLPPVSSARPLASLWSSVAVANRATMDSAARRSSQQQVATPALPQSPEALAVKLKKAPLEPTDVGLPINLATALRLSDARPLIVAAAQASVWVAEAELTRAKVLWVPSFMAGSDYIRHDGGGPDFNKGVMTVDSVNFNYTGAGFWQNVNLTDVIFQPLAARQNLNSRQADIQTAKNDVLFQTADTYFLVHQFRGMYSGALYAVERGHDLVERILQMSKDLVPADEVDRARNMVADLEQQATSAREMWRLHSADLTQVLRLDPRTVVVPLEHDHLQITLIDPNQSLPDLMRIAVNNRPEITSRRALVLAAEANVNREKWRPVLPVFMLNGFQAAGMYLQFGMFGLGPNSSMNQWFGRDDVSLQLMWQFDALGIGNLARIKNSTR